VTPMAKMKIERVLASIPQGEELDLPSIALALDGAEHEPEQFSGLIYRIDGPKVVVQLFGSGKLVCTGARKPQDVESAENRMTEEQKAAGLLR